MEWHRIIPAFLFNGGKQSCNICGATPRFWLTRGHSNALFETLGVVGAGKRKTNCISCGSSDRDRLIALFLAEYNIPQNTQKPLHLLHIAPEKALSKWLKKNKSFRSTQADNRQKGYKLSYSSKVEFADVQDLPYLNNYFDWIICNHVLEHVPNDLNAMKEIYRVLKFNGHGILQVPLALKLEKTIESEISWTETDCKEKLGQWDHKRLYGLDYIEKLKSVGFEVELWEPKNKNDFNQYCLNNKEFIVHIKK